VGGNSRRFINNYQVFVLEHDREAGHLYRGDLKTVFRGGQIYLNHLIDYEAIRLGQRLTAGGNLASFGEFGHCRSRETKHFGDASINP
jgi:hypothetical protein